MSKNIKTTDDVYNVDNYTDKELYDILGLNNPSDRELEAKIFQLAKKYKNMDNVSGNKLAVFFENIYDRFFEIEDNVENGRTLVISCELDMEKEKVSVKLHYRYLRGYLYCFVEELHF
jgi:hypothetical protein